jgi:hypothetical protein
MASTTTQRYKITNTTQKPLRTNARGEDLRPVKERVGHGIQFHLSNPDELITLYANQNVIVDRINDGVLRLFRKRLISVETVADIADELRKLAFKPAEQEAPAQPPPASVDGALEKMNARSYPMGETREGEAVNPDGEPNFVARAPKGGLSRQPKKE